MAMLRPGLGLIGEWIPLSLADHTEFDRTHPSRGHLFNGGHRELLAGRASNRRGLLWSGLGDGDLDADGVRRHRGRDLTGQPVGRGVELELVDD